MKKNKVIFLTPTLEMHGGNIIMMRYVNLLLKHGVTVSIITTDKPVAFKIDKRVKILKCKRIKIKYFDFFIFQLIYLKKMINFIDDCDFVIPIYGPLILHAILARKIKKMNYKILPLFQDSLNTLWVGPYIRFLLNRNFIMKNIDGIFLCSKVFFNFFEKYTCKKYFLPNGIDFGEFNYQNNIKKCKYILFVGRPNKPKGFDIFVKALKIVRKNDSNIIGIVVCPDGSNKKIKGIKFINYINRKQLADIYRKALIYVSASRAESFGLSPLEAMASGTPVVMTANGAEINYAEDNKNCILVKNGDYKFLALAIMNVLKNNLMRKTMISNGFNTVRKFDWKNPEQTFLNVLIQ